MSKARKIVAPLVTALAAFGLVIGVSVTGHHDSPTPTLVPVSTIMAGYQIPQFGVSFTPAAQTQVATAQADTTVRTMCAKSQQVAHFCQSATPDSIQLVNMTNTFGSTAVGKIANRPVYLLNWNSMACPPRYGMAPAAGSTTAPAYDASGQRCDWTDVIDQATDTYLQAWSVPAGSS